MIRAAGSLLLVYVLAVVPGVSAFAARTAPPFDERFEERAERWLERHGVAELTEPDVDLILDQGFARLRLGLFDVRIPAAALADDGWLPVLRGCARTLLDVQLEWVAWLPPEEGQGVPPKLKGHAKTLSAWLKGWKRKRFSDPEAVRGKDLLEVSGAKEKVRRASAFLADYMGAGGPLGPREDPFPAARVVLLPERADFVEFSALVGRLDPSQRPYLWLPGAALWTYFDFGDAVAVALEYATPDGERDYSESISMTYKNAKAREEHVAQLATRALLDRVYGDRMEPMVAAGLANNLVIALFEEVDTRTDGDARGRTTSGRSVFIPGGNPGGGSLAAQVADSRWRELKGKDYFVGALRKAQKAGAKEASEKWQKVASFVLLDDSQSKAHVVHAPFLGPAAIEPPPEDFGGDYAELLRAYRSAFLHWLQEEADGRRSRASFGRLLRVMVAGEGDLPAHFLETYGLPLSAPGPELHESLEGSFLVWLAKQ